MTDRPVMLLSHLVSKHFQNRLKEYLEIRGELTPRRVKEHLSRIIQEIHQFLRP